MAEMIRMGDSTTHGGKVLQGVATYLVAGRPAAGKGHMVFCPQCKGVFPIAEGNPTVLSNGIELAYHGMRTACGAILLASQGSVLHGIANTHDAHDATRPEHLRMKLFDEQMQAIDSLNGQAVAFQPYRLALANGTVFDGTTDEKGRTVRTHTLASEPLTVSWINATEKNDFPDEPYDDGGC